MRIFYILFFFSAYMYSATCTQNTAYINVMINLPFKTYNIQQDDSEIRVLDTFFLPFGPENLKTFALNGGNCGDSFLHGNYINNWIANSDGIAPTNIKGLGIRISMDRFLLNYTYGPPKKDGLVNSWKIAYPNWKIEIIKTGKITTSGYVKSGGIARMTQQNPAPHNSTWYISTLNIPINAIRINSISCSLGASTYNINLGSWLDMNLKEIGATTPMVNMPILLNCNEGTNIKALITSNNGYVDATNGILKLVTGISSAKGIGIQLIRGDGTPIELNKKIIIKNSMATNSLTLPWKARYIRLNEPLISGNANSTATVNITYE